MFQGKLQRLEVALADYSRIDGIGRGCFGELYRPGPTDDLSQHNVEGMFQRQIVPFWRADPLAILTEYLERGSLQAMIRAEREGTAPRCWTETTRFIVLYGVAVAMMVLHENRILHRDLKPDTILLNSRLEPRVADFGLSKFVEAGATMMQTVQAGTVPFMAPEIYEGHDYSFPVDVYAYGVLLYVTLTGQDFFPGIQNAWTFGAKIRRGERPPIPVHVRQQWRELIERCWAADPPTRPSFVDIVCWFGTVRFVNPRIDVDRFREYQKRIVSEEFWSEDGAPPAAPAPTPTPAPVTAASQLEMMKLAADGGDPYCANMYGCRLRDGIGVKADAVGAAEYFRRSAEGGDTEGMINWAVCLEHGRGVSADAGESGRWYEAAMTKGDIHGMFCYADMLEHGRGVPKDEVKAAQLYKQAADSGHDRAQCEYGMICELGRFGVPRNPSEAVHYYLMASDQGSPHGMMCLAGMLEHGRGVPADQDAALRLYRLAAERGDAKALGCVGYKMVAGIDITRDVEGGRALIQRQIDLGDAAGFLHFARIAEEGLAAPPDLAEAYRYYAMAAGRGIASGILTMARMMMLGQGTTQSVVGALDMYNSMIEQTQNTDAMVQLAVHHIQGAGVGQDVDRGTALLRWAALLEIHRPSTSSAYSALAQWLQSGGF
jgi:TPR repeat protein